MGGSLSIWGSGGRCMVTCHSFPMVVFDPFFNVNINVNVIPKPPFESSIVSRE
jgi:hypothetical protein